MTAAEGYRARDDAVRSQASRLEGGQAGPVLWDQMAAQFRLDPRRPLDPNMEALSAFIESEDTIVDVGGGAGRVSLPFAGRAREIINVEPSPGMVTQFEESAAEARIRNARAVAAEWMADHGVSGDVSLVFNVTYFVGEIVPFVEKLVASTRRRVVIGVWSVPPPDQSAVLFDVIYGERQERVPGHRELLAVLWEMGILPDVRVLPSPFRNRTPTPQTREETVRAWAQQSRAREIERAAERIDGAFESLFVQGPDGYLPTFRPDAREMLITWETGRR